MSAPRLSETQKEAILADYRGGIPIIEIAERHGVDPSYPALLVKRRGLPSRSTPHPTMMEDILAAVTFEWSSAREIWQRMGMWSLTATRERLAWLVESGEIERKGVPTLYSYRRSADGASP